MGNNVQEYDIIAYVSDVFRGAQPPQATYTPGELFIQQMKSVPFSYTKGAHNIDVKCTCIGISRAFIAVDKEGTPYIVTVCDASHFELWCRDCDRVVNLYSRRAH